MDSSHNIKVSVIISTFKRADMIHRAINSVLNQTYKNIEVIVVDDNNPDSIYRSETEKIMSTYSDKRVKYIKHERNRNGAAARNTGIANSEGEVVCFLDDDDWYMPDKIELQLKYLIENDKFGAVYCGWDRDNKKVIPTLQGNLAFELLSGEALIYTNTIMMWRSIAVEIGGWDDSFLRNQEAVFLLRFFKHGYEIGVVSKILVEFNISDRSNVLNAQGNKKQFDLYLTKHEDMISVCEQSIKNARKIIYSYRYRGILLAFCKQKEFKGAIGVYLTMMRYIPIRFNRDLFKYTYKRLLKNG